MTYSEKLKIKDTEVNEMTELAGCMDAREWWASHCPSCLQMT